MLLRGMVEESVEEGAMVYTDQNVATRALQRSPFPSHLFLVNHSVGEYIKGQLLILNLSRVLLV